MCHYPRWEMHQPGCRVFRRRSRTTLLTVALSSNDGAQEGMHSCSTDYVAVPDRWSTTWRE